MIAYYAALTTREVESLKDRVRQGGHEALEEELSIYMGDDERCIDIDKAWHGIHVMLCDEPQNVCGSLKELIFGGETLDDEDLAYLPARLFSPALASELALAIRDIDLLAMREVFRSVVMGKDEVYPGLPDEDDINYLDYNFEILKRFLQSAAGSGSAVLTFIS